MAKAATLPSQERTFTSVLDMTGEEVERPKAMPVGQYIFIVKGQPTFGKSKEKQTDFVQFQMSVLNPIEDTVDPDALEEWLTKKDGSKRNIQEVTQRLTFYLVESAVWRLKDFLTHCGVYEDGVSLRQMIAETPGCQVIGTIKHRSSDDGQSTFASIDSTAATD